MEQEMPVGLRFSLLHRSFRRRMDELLREKDLTGVQLGVLGALERLEREDAGEVNQKDLEQLTRVTHPTMTDLLRRLEKKELIRCEVSCRDRRYKCISSTEKAEALKQELGRVEEETFRWLCRGLSAGQIEELLRITDVMLQNVTESCGKGCDPGCD